MAREAEDPPALLCGRGKEPMQPEDPYDLRHELAARAGQPRSVHRSRGYTPAARDGYQAWRDRNDRAREQHHARMTVDLRCDVARVRGVAHPMCFTDEVMQHQFPEGFKFVNFKQYDETTD